MRDEIRRLVVAEVEAVLELDQTALGDIYRRSLLGETPKEIQEAHGAGHPNFVHAYLRAIKAILHGNFTSSPSEAVRSSRRLRRLLSENSFTDVVRQALGVRLKILEKRALDPRARGKLERRGARPVDIVDIVEPLSGSGLYVYALPHYLRHPVDEVSGRTWLKVGHSTFSVRDRVLEQGRKTALPEDPILLRCYPTSPQESAEFERRVHRLLEAAGHGRNESRSGGTEFFLTTLRFLDTIAFELGLDVIVVCEDHVVIPA